MAKRTRLASQQPRQAIRSTAATAAAEKKVRAEVSAQLNTELAKLERMYQVTGNPLFVWSAYGLVRGLGEIPDWVLAAFDRYANDLLRINTPEEAILLRKKAEQGFLANVHTAGARLPHSGGPRWGPDESVS